MTTTISSNFLEKSSKSNQTISISSATYDFNETLDITDNPYKTIKLYPNPANDYLKLNSDEYKEYIIYSSLGKKIQSKKIKNQTISINNLSKGLYYIKFDNNATYRFIKN